MLRARRTAAAVLIALPAAACEREAARSAAAGAPAVAAGGGPAACDSAAAASVALDTLGRVAPFRSGVLRFGRDTAGFRIVTRPADPGVLDGMAVVRVGRDCRVRTLVQTDSA